MPNGMSCEILQQSFRAVEVLNRFASSHSPGASVCPAVVSDCMPRFHSGSNEFRELLRLRSEKEESGVCLSSTQIVKKPLCAFRMWPVVEGEVDTRVTLRRVRATSPYDIAEEGSREAG